MGFCAHQKLGNPLTVCQQTDEHPGIGMSLYIVEHHSRTANLGGTHDGSACTHIAVDPRKLGGRIDFHIGGHQLTGHILQQLQGAAKIVNLHENHSRHTVFYEIRSKRPDMFLELL